MIDNETNESGTAQKIREVFDENRDLVIAKNTDYGDSAFKPPLLCPEMSVDKAIQVRMSDKLERIKRLESNPAQVKGESLADAYRDLMGYCALRLVELEMT